MSMAVRVALVSLGCPKNLVDSEVMLGLLETAGYEIVEDVTAAEVVIVNTCAFIEPAVAEAVAALLDLAELKDDGAHCLICAGCLTQRYGEELVAELPEVDGFVGPGSVGRIAQVVDRCLGGERVVAADMPPYLYRWDTPRVRTGREWLAYVKIADGCSHRCAYCLIPSLRGPYRSRQPEDIGAEVCALIGEGVREICLIAQDTSAWGRDLEGDRSLADLLRGLDLRGYDGWVRLQYLHPKGISDELLSAVAEIDQVVPYFDVPLQHCDREVLRRMGRGGSEREHLALTERIRASVPGAALRTTLIVGYPGETRRRFDDLLRFVGTARFDRLSAFRYWDEPGTRSHTQSDKVPPGEAQDRLEELMMLQEGISRRMNQELLGARMRVLLEERAETPGQMLGRSYRDAPDIDGQVLVENVAQRHQGEFVEVEVSGAGAHDLRGRSRGDRAGASRKGNCPDGD